MRKLFVVISCLFVPSALLAQEASSILNLKDQGMRDTLLANVLAQKSQNETFNPLQEYRLSGTAYGASQSFALTPNKLFDCRDKCIIITLSNNVLKSTFKMDFLNTQPYTLLGEYKVAYSGVSTAAPIVDVRKNKSSYSFYLNSSYGARGAVTFIPINGNQN